MTATREGKKIDEACNVIQNKKVITVGKDRHHVDIAAEHPSCSRLHAVLIASEARGLLLVDLGSAGGTRLDGAELLPFLAAAVPNAASGGHRLAFARSSRRFSVALELRADERRRAELYRRMGDPTAAAPDEADATVFVGNLPASAGEEEVR